MPGRTLGLAVLAVLTFPAAAMAADVPVDCNVAGQLQNALTTANAGDRILVEQGDTCSEATYVVPSGKPLTLEGAGGGATFSSSSGRSLTWNDAGAAQLRNLSFTSSGSGNGGVEFTGTSTPTIDNVRFLRNQVVGDGGGLKITAAGTGPIVIKDSTFGNGSQPNRATDSGAGLWISAMGGATVTIDHTDFLANLAGDRAAGAFISGSGDITITDSDFEDNHVGLFGDPTVGTSTIMYAGAAHVSSSAGTVTLAGNVFITNDVRPAPNGSTMAAYAGALSIVGVLDGSKPVTMTDNELRFNEITSSGASVGTVGGGASFNGRMIMQGNRWIGNALRDNGTGVADGSAFRLEGPCDSSASPTTLRNEWIGLNVVSLGVGGTMDFEQCGGTPSTILADNVTVSDNTQQDASTTVVSDSSVSVLFRNSLFWNNAGGGEMSGTSAGATYSDICAGASPFAGTGNICADPLFVNAFDGAVQDGSPVIDRGDDSLVPAGLATDILGAPRIADGDADASCAAVVDMGAWEHPGVSCTVPVTTPPTPPPPAPTLPPATAPPVITDPGQVLLCEGRSVVLIDIRRKGRFQVLRGLSKKSLAGRRITITGDHKAGRFSAKVGADGSFTAKVPNPKSNQTSYVASYGRERSVPLKVSRNLSVISQRKAAGGVRIVARHSKGKRVAGDVASLRRQTSCGVQGVAATARFDRRGRVTFLLPAPTPPDTVAVYRVTTKVNNTFTLPIVVRP